MSINRRKKEKTIIEEAEEIVKSYMEKQKTPKENRILFHLGHIYIVKGGLDGKSI